VQTWNLARRFVDVQAEFLFRTGFSVVIPDDPRTKENENKDREPIRAALAEMWRRNGGAAWAMEAGQMAGITGDAFMRVSWDDTDPTDEPFVRIDLIPSQYVFPDFGGPFGVDRKFVRSVLLLFPQYADEDANRGLNIGGKKEIKLYAERWYPDRVEIFNDSDNPKVRPNPLGEIPVVHVPNYSVPGEFYGLSDLADLEGLQKTINEKSTDISDIIDYFGSPVTIVAGASIKEMEKGSNKLWSIPKDATVTNLTLDTDLGAAVTFLERLISTMHFVAGVPEVAMNPGLGGGDTGVAMAQKFLPLLNRLAVKQALWSRGLAQVQRLALRTQATIDSDLAEALRALPVKTRYRTDVGFKPILPRDEAMELEKAEKRLDLKLTSRRREQMNTLNLSQGEIDQVEDEIREDIELASDAEFALGQKFADSTGGSDLYDTRDKQKNRSGNPDPKKPNPDTQGEAKSRNAEQK